jgi:hypothetical protein
LKRIALGLAVVGLASPLVASCDRSHDAASLSAAEELEALLRPPALATSLKKLPGAHFAGTALFRITPTGKAAEEPGEGLTTTTDLSLDPHGQYRLVESNDQDGGREVVLFGKELAVAIRPGKLIRRTAQEPEPTRILEEAVGGPWAAWETVRRFVAIEHTSATSFHLKRSTRPVPIAASFAEATPLRRWRDSVSVETLEGEVELDPQTRVPLAFTLKARFTAIREDHVALTGELAVTTKVDGVGHTTVAAPASEPLQTRQRTILEERALLGDLGRAGKEGR